MINMSEMINDPDFSQPNGISITRYKSSVVNHRIVTATENLNVPGIITIAKENSSDSTECASLNTESINIYTFEKLKCTGKDKVTGEKFIADEIHFNNADYRVTDSLDNTQYGFCKATAEKIEQDVM